MSRALFDGYNVVVEGPSLMKEIRKKAQPYGLKLNYSVQKDTKLYVGNRDLIPSNSTKLKQAKRNNIPLVDHSYIDACIKCNSILPVEEYPLYQTLVEIKHDGPVPMEIDIIEENHKNNETKSKENSISVHSSIPLSSGWREAKVFISSTFRDMHGERDYLTKFIFPELQDRCNKIHVHVNVVDLRWGVTEEESKNGAALQLCLEQVDECRPFFIGLLGTRYGWIPNSYEISSKDSKFDWLTRGHAPGYSVTHLEMEYGALLPVAKEKSEPLIYIRDSKFLADVPREFVGDFLPETDDAERKLNTLKQQLQQNGLIQMQRYPCNWKGIQDGKPMTGGLEQLGSHILESLWKQIEIKFPYQSNELSPLQIIREQHDSFIESHSRVFVGRQNLLNTLETQLFSVPFNQQDNIPLVVEGLPGSGKTSLMCAFARNITQRANNEDFYIVPHFIGGAPGSTSLRMTLHRLCQEIYKAWNIDDIDKVPQSYSDLEAEFVRLVSVAPINCTRKPILIILDALNQFDEANSPWTMQWLPFTLCKEVKVIVSSLKGKYIDTLSSDWHIPFITVESLSKNESKAIVEERLAKYSKKLNNTQMDLLLSKTEANKPLYLTIACEELRVFGVFEKLEERIRTMASNVPSLFVEVLHRLEKDFGSELVKACLSLLASVRNGLTENELKSILGGWDNPMIHSIKEIKPLEDAKWKYLERGLREYLTNSGESNSSRITFFHEQLLFAVRKAYLVPSDDYTEEPGKQELYSDIPMWKKAHIKLAEYFLLKSDPKEDKTFKGSIRDIVEVPYHLTSSHQWKKTIDIMCDLAFMESKAAGGYTFDLLQDFILLLSPENQKMISSNLSLDLDECKQYLIQAKQFHQFLKAKAHILHRRPQLTFSVALSLPDSYYPCKAANSRWNAGLETRTHIRWENKPSVPDACMMTLSGHTMVVRHCAVSQTDNPLIASASHDLSVRIWNPQTGEQIASMMGHTRSIDHCAFSPDGLSLVTCGWDKTVRVWDLTTFQQKYSFTNHSTVLHCCTYSPCGNKILSGDRNGFIREYSSNGTQLNQWKAHNGAIFKIKYSPVGNIVASVSEDKRVKLHQYSNSSWNTVFTGLEHIKGVNSCCFSPDGSLLATCGDDKTIVLWDVTDVNNVSCVTKINGHADGIVDICFHTTEYKLISASHDNIIILWNLENLQCESWYLGHTGSVFSCEFFPQSDWFVSSSFDRSVKVWDSSHKIESLDGHTGRVLGVSYSNDGKKIATASRDKTAKVWNINDDSIKKGIVCTMNEHRSNVFDIAFSPDSTRMLTVSRDTNAIISDANTGACINTFTEHKLKVWGCDFHPDGIHVATAGEDKVTYIWNSRTLAITGKLYGHRAPVICVAFSPDGEKVVTGSEDKTLKLWNVKTNRKLATLCGHTSTVSTCTFSRDSTKILSGDEDNVVIEWSAINAKKLAVITGHDAPIKGCCYSADGKRIITASTDSMAIMWDAISKREICSFACLSRITSLDTSKLGSVFAVGDGSGTLYSLRPVGDEISDALDKENTNKNFS